MRTVYFIEWELPDEDKCRFSEKKQEEAYMTLVLPSHNHDLSDVDSDSVSRVVCNTKAEGETCEAYIKAHFALYGMDPVFST